MKKTKLIPTMDWIIKDTNILLREKSNIVIFPLKENEEDIVNKMVCYIDSSYNEEAKKNKITPGIAIAAIQMGLKKRIIYANFISENNEQVKFLLANPKIVGYSPIYAFLKAGEGCLSDTMPHEGQVLRRNKIIVEAIDMLDNNNLKKISFEGTSAICMQHEIDHLNGMLYYDHISKTKPFIDNSEKKHIEY